MLTSLLLAVGAPADAAPRCSVTDRPVITRVADLPPAVRAAIKEPIADPGQPFNPNDVIWPDSPPSQRLICAYPVPGGFVIERAYGGRVSGRDRQTFRKTPTGFLNGDPHSWM